MEREVGFQAGLNQQFWLAPVIDRLLLGGICMALVYDWAKTGAFGGDPTHLLDELFDQSGPAWQRKLSFQRAYDFTWYDIGRQQPYIQFHNTLETATSRFLPQNGARDGMTITRVLHTPNRDVCEHYLNNNMAPGRIYMLMIDGDGNAREPTGIWGHFVGIGVTSQPLPQRPRYFDPNTGLFYVTGTGTTGTEVTTAINNTYHNTYHLNVRGYVLYRCARA